METPKTHLDKATLNFLKELAKNNNRDWFTTNKPLYEAARLDLLGVCTAIVQAAHTFDERVASNDPNKSIYRIYRDVRFSKNKSPYKTNLAAGFNPEGKPNLATGYFIQIEPGDKSFVAGGLYMPSGPALKAIRQEIDFNPDKWLALVDGPEAKGYFESLTNNDALKTMPKGYDKDHPLAHYLKLKSFEFVHKLPDATLTKPGAVEVITDGFRRLRTIMEFFIEATAEVPMPEPVKP